MIRKRYILDDKKDPTIVYFLFNGSRFFSCLEIEYLLTQDYCNCEWIY